MFSNEFWGGMIETLERLAEELRLGAAPCRRALKTTPGTVAGMVPNFRDAVVSVLWSS